MKQYIALSHNDNNKNVTNKIDISQLYNSLESCINHIEALTGADKSTLQNSIKKNGDTLYYDKITVTLKIMDIDASVNIKYI